MKRRSSAPASPSSSGSETPAQRPADGLKNLADSRACATDAVRAGMRRHVDACLAGFAIFSALCAFLITSQPSMIAMADAARAPVAWAFLATAAIDILAISRWRNLFGEPD